MRLLKRNAIMKYFKRIRILSFINDILNAPRPFNANKCEIKHDMRLSAGKI